MKREEMIEMLAAAAEMVRRPQHWERTERWSMADELDDAIRRLDAGEEVTG